METEKLKATHPKQCHMFLLAAPMLSALVLSAAIMY